MLKFTGQSLKTALTGFNHSKIIFLFLLLLITQLQGPAAFAEETPLFFGEKSRLFHGEKKQVAVLTREGLRTVSLPGGLRAAMLRKNSLCYLRIDKDGQKEPENTEDAEEKETPRPRLMAGLLRLDEESKAVEWPLAGVAAQSVIKKIDFYRGVFFLLYEKEKRDEAGGSLQLLRLNFNTGAVNTCDSAVDFLLHRGSMLVLEGCPDACRVNVNGRHVPLTLRGKAALQEVIDGRLLLVRGRDENEVIDLGAMKNIYRYGENRVPVEPGEENLVVVVKDADVSEKQKEELVFYKVFIDGREMGRTETGPAPLEKKMQTGAGQGAWHILRLERWELHRQRRRYQRANNIVQPRPSRIYLPTGRLIRVSVIFDGKEHSIATETVMKEAATDSSAGE